MKGLTVTKNVEEINFDVIWDELESRKVSGDNNSQNI